MIMSRPQPEVAIVGIGSTGFTTKNSDQSTGAYAYRAAVAAIADAGLGREDIDGVVSSLQLAPGPDALKALLAGRQADTTDTEDVTVPPGCADAGAQAAGAVRFPAGTTTYVGTSVPPSGDSGPAGTSCYGGRIELTGNVVVFGSADLLRNDVLADPGVAALDLNALDQNGRGGASLTWLLPGADARGSGPATIWTVLPGWTPRAVVWLLVIGGLVVLWRARRLGPVVGEPLPVVVRAVEIVEGHGRLYLRAGARDRAAGQLRAATSRRLADRFGMPPAAIPLTAEERATLSGPPPVDDAELVRLANALHELDRGGSRHD